MLASIYSVEAWIGHCYRWRRESVRGLSLASFEHGVESHTPVHHCRILLDIGDRTGASKYAPRGTRFPFFADILLYAVQGDGFGDIDGGSVYCYTWLQTRIATD